MLSPHLLLNTIHIQTTGMRSIRIEEDFSEKTFIHGYVLTSQAKTALERIFTGIEHNGTRAWTITGPYGSGKSYFGLFLRHVLDGKFAPPEVRQKLTALYPDLAKRISQWVNGTHGLLTVSITGTSISLPACLKRGFIKALEELNDSQAETFLNELRAIPDQDSRAFLEWVKHFVNQMSSPRGKYAGVLLIVDELGKLLEYAANHPQESDIYFLQELAEFADRSGQTPFIFVGILHQAFEHYAGLLDRTTYREWAKVQGRFEDISYLEPAVQQMRLLSRVFQHEDLPPNLIEQIPQMVNRATKAGWKPKTMPEDEYQQLCIKVYPLHPTTFSVLPLLFRRLGQNERSIFTYLTSNEPNGFTEFLETHSLGEFIRLPHLFNYLATNYGTHLYASGRAHPFIEAMDLLANSEVLSPLEQDLLKTISLLNWLSESGNLTASEERILSALAETPEEEATFRAGLEKLRQRSFISFRSFNQSYVIWQGSDVDIEARLQAALNSQNANFSLAEVLQEILPPRPIAARKHSYERGTLRFFDVRYVDTLDWEKEGLSSPTRYASGVIYLCLPTTPTEIDQFVNWAQEKPLADQENLVIGISGQAIRIKQLVQELRGLYWIKENTPELMGDRVATRELRTRTAMLEGLIRNELDQAFNINQLSVLSGCRWFYKGMDVSAGVKRGLSHLLSDICDQLYSKSPRIWNELLNRRELTSQGSAARRNLIEGILTRAEHPLLGIEGFPPERGMYEAVLKENGMHRQTSEGWRITPPEGNNLKAVWRAIEDFVFTEPPAPRPLSDLYTQLNAPPFGLTQGVIPVLLAVFYKVYENELSLYKDGTLLAPPDIPDWEVLLRRPELFAIGGCRVTGLRAAIVERMARGLKVAPYVMPVVSTLIVRLKSLPEHAWRTNRLPETAIALRRTVDITRSPERFLFVELPSALGVAPFLEGDFNQEAFEAFFSALNNALDALANATPRLLDWARDTWLKACGFPQGEEGWLIFLQQAKDLVVRVTYPQLIPVIKRAAEAPNANIALESVLAQIANCPLRSWTDADADRFEAQARYLGTMLQRELSEEAMEKQLDAEIRSRSEALAQKLTDYLQIMNEEPLVVKNAIRILLKRNY